MIGLDLRRKRLVPTFQAGGNDIPSSNCLSVGEAGVHGLPENESGEVDVVLVGDGLVYRVQLGRIDFESTLVHQRERNIFPEKVEIASPPKRGRGGIQWMGICKGIGTAEMSVRVEGFGDDLVRSEETYGCQYYPLTTFQTGLIQINQLPYAGGMALLSCLSHRRCSRATQMDGRECNDCAEQKRIVQRMAGHFFCEALECIAQVILRSQARNVVLEEPGI